MAHECYFKGKKGCEKEASESLPFADGTTMWLCDHCHDKAASIVKGWCAGSDGPERRELAEAYMKKHPNIAAYWREK